MLQLDTNPDPLIDINKIPDDQSLFYYFHNQIKEFLNLTLNYNLELHL